MLLKLIPESEMVHVCGIVKTFRVLVCITRGRHTHAINYLIASIAKASSISGLRSLICMAQRWSEADSAWEFNHNNASSFMHISHFKYHPITVDLLYGVIADQLNQTLLKLPIKLEKIRTWHHQNFGGPCMDFSVSHTHAIA